MSRNGSRPAPQEAAAVPVDPAQLGAQITGNDAARLGYDVEEMLQVPGGLVIPSQQAEQDYHTNNPEYNPQRMQAEHVNPWVLAQRYDPGRGMEVPKFNYMKTGSTVAPGDAVLEEDGRTYHGYKEGAYLLPNDGEEQDRLDLQHHTFRLTLNGALATAPIPQPFTGTCLDIATGTGIWALDFAQENPGATVIGADLSQIQPERLNVPNCTFLKQDVEETHWILGNNHNPMMFDYIHSRMVVSCFNSHLQVMQNCFKHMNPGGWIEFHDGVADVTSFDGSHNGTAFHHAWRLCVQGGAMYGRDFFKTTQYKNLLAEAGFVDISERKILIPTGVWPADPKMKELAGYSAENLVQVLKSAGGKILKRAGMDQETLDKLPWMLRKEMLNPHLHFEWPFYVVCGRKPFDWEIQQPKRHRGEEEVKPGPSVENGSRKNEAGAA